MNYSVMPATSAKTVDQAFARLVEELSRKIQAGEAIDVETYCRLHADQADRLRNLLPTLGVLAALAQAGNLPAALGDFRLRREVGRGGMGVVYEAEQVSLGRRVAVKVLPFAAALDAQQLQRFKHEAQVAALLHHTNIVPVHAVGCDSDVHYYAMQFIEGQSLAQLIDGLCEQLGAQTVKARRSSLELRSSWSTRDPSYFHAVARLGMEAGEGLQHAHEMGVVHRDIKPANLLVDARGHLWVTDFGLAQYHADIGLTLTGDMVGTLRYMSPEQASARGPAVDHRTDVYSLGVTLYELLTLAPAFAGRDRHELLRQVAEVEPPRPRRLRPEIPEELEVIVLKAMAKEPVDRYATAQELANDLRSYLEDRPIRARRLPWRRRAFRWVRRHKPLTTAAAAVVLLLLFLAGSFGWLQHERTLTEQAVSAELSAAEASLSEAHWAEARQALDRAESRLAGGGPAYLRDRLQRLQDSLAFAAELDEARMQQLTLTGDGFDYEGTDQAYAKAFTDHGLDVAALEPDEAVAQIRGSPIQMQLTAALDYWAEVRERHGKARGKPLQALAGLADDNPWRQQLRNLAAHRDGGALERLAERDDVDSQPVEDLELLGLRLFGNGRLAAAERLLRKAQRLYPDDFWVNFQLAVTLASTETLEGKRAAVGFYRAALVLRPQSPRLYNNLGCALGVSETLPEAADCFRQAIALKPDLAPAYNNLGVALMHQHRALEALDSFRQALALKPRYPEALQNLGAALCEQGELVKASDALRRAIAIKKDYAQAYFSLGAVLQAQGTITDAIDVYRKGLAFKEDHADVHFTVGSCLQRQGKVPEAVVHLRRAIEIQPSHAMAHTNLAAALRGQGNLSEAIIHYRGALAYDPDQVNVLFNLGVALGHQKRPAEAAECFSRVIALRPDHAEAHCGYGDALQVQGRFLEAVQAYGKALAHRPDFPLALYNLGTMLARRGQTDEAVRHLRRAIALRPDYAEAYCNLGTALQSQGKITEAAEAFQRAVAIRPNYVMALYNLGSILRDQGDLPGAIKRYRRAIKANPDYAEAYCGLGQTLTRQGRFAEALTALKRGHELGSKNPRWPHSSAQWVREAERLVGLEARLPKVLKGEVEPTSAVERVELAAFCLVHKQQPCEAARLYQQAFAEQPKLAIDLGSGHRYNAACAAARAGCGHGKQVDTPDAQERTRLRQQARTWLREDLDAQRQFLDMDPKRLGPVVRQRVQHWQKDADLAGVRDRDNLATLPEAERRDWEKLWTDVEALHQCAANSK
jgi:tetratricopeptide (TPR) repeat protein/tRNA A-37 threonylcarbamoyl transferase component Bud32